MQSTQREAFEKMTKEAMGFTTEPMNCENCRFMTYSDDHGYYCTYSPLCTFRTMPRYRCSVFQHKPDKPDKKAAYENLEDNK